MSPVSETIKSMQLLGTPERAANHCAVADLCIHEH